MPLTPFSVELQNRTDAKNFTVAANHQSSQVSNQVDLVHSRLQLNPHSWVHIHTLLEIQFEMGLF